MRILLVAALTGCSAVSAVGSFIKPAPPVVTVNTHVEVKAEKSSGTTTMVAGAVAGGVTAALIHTTPESIAAGALVGTALGYVVHSALD